MTQDGIEPLEPETWLAQLAKLAKRPLENGAMSPSLRLAFHLVQLTPRPLRHLIRCPLDERGFEQLLESGTLTEAALALIGDQMGYLVTRPAASGLVMAEVCLPGEVRGPRVSAATAAEALFRAWLARLGALDENALPAVEATPPSRHRARSALRPRSTEH